MNELKHIWSKYFGAGETFKINYHGKDIDSEKALTEIEKYFSHFKQFDRPDIYAKIGAEVFLLEHFEFDSAEHIQHGGSLQKHEEARIEKTFQYAVNQSENKTTRVHDEISSNPTLDNYKNNFIRVFIRHYKRIPEYIKNLKTNKIISNQSIIKIGFFIEDSSALGNVYLDNDNKPRFLPVLYADFFWKLIENHKKDLNYVLFGFFDGKKDNVFFVDINTSYDYSPNLVKLTETNFFSFSPQVTSFSIEIPKEDKQKNKKA